jgi:glycine cleavage system aminomethyltransferase T
MGISIKVDTNWEHLYTQLKGPTGESVVCMMHKETKKFVYFDIQLNRVLTKKEALIYRVDATGKYSAQMPVE